MTLRDFLKDVNSQRIIDMLLLHDLGEIYEGDIPAFEKKDANEQEEQSDFKNLANLLPEKMRARWVELWAEFHECKTEEAKIARAIDKLEAVMQHNSAELSTWTPVEYDMNLSYGVKECGINSLLDKIRTLAQEDTKKKISN